MNVARSTIPYYRMIMVMNPYEYYSIGKEHGLLYIEVKV